MFKANGFYGQLAGNYLFSEIAKRAAIFQSSMPDADVIRMGIGDVTCPLVPAVIDAMHKAVDDMAQADTFRGYGPDFGYDFLREAIRRRDYESRHISLECAEIFVSDGAKCDVGNIQELFSPDSVVAVMDPVYPVYVDTNIMSGRGGQYLPARGAYENIVYLPCTAENNFVPALPEVPVDVLYLCYPNNPTGMTLSRKQLKRFVDWAREHHALILYDSAYEAYITEPDVPHSIYEVDGAMECAIEFRSFSKTAGFTGVRCSYTVVPKALNAIDTFGRTVSLNEMWARRQATKLNGVSYVTQRGAEAALSKDGYMQVMSVVKDYMKNAAIIRDSLSAAGYTVYGGVNAPYIWFRTPNVDSWAFFDELLSKHHIIGTPGAGFGAAGEGYFRMTAFASRENTIRAMERMKRG